MSEHVIPPNIDLIAFRAAVVAAIREPTGIKYGNGAFVEPTHAEFTPDLNASEIVTYQSIADDFVSASIDRAAMVAAQAQTWLTQIANRKTAITAARTEVASDITALAAASTLAAAKPIIARMLARQDNDLQAENATLDGLAVIIKALRRLV